MQHVRLIASLAQLVEHALRKRMVVGSIPTGGFAYLAATRIQLHKPHHPPEPNLKFRRKTMFLQDLGH